MVDVGVSKGLGSVKETVSAIQELSKRRERESVTTLLLCKESLSKERLIGFALPIRHLSSSIQYVSTRMTAIAHTTAPQEGSGILTVLLQLGSVDAHFLA